MGSYLDDFWPALITASGLSPLATMLRTWALVSGVAQKSSTVVITCCVEVLNALICAAALVSRGAGHNLVKRITPSHGVKTYFF